MRDVLRMNEPAGYDKSPGNHDRYGKAGVAMRGGSVINPAPERGGAARRPR
jgi:hypothetical protein